MNQSSEESAGAGDIDELVMIAKFSNPMEAYVARSALEAEGIEAVVQEDQVLGPVVGVTRLRVRRADLGRAHEVFSEIAEETAREAEAALPEQGRRCPQCGSTDIAAREEYSLMRLAMILFGAVPPPSHHWVCRGCRHEWGGSTEST